MNGKLLIAGALIALASGCGESRAQMGATAERQYRVGAFNEISVAGPYQVQVSTSGAPSVRASGPQELIDRLVVEVRDGHLRIHPRNDNFNWSSSRGTATVQVTGPMLRAAAVAGSGKLQVDRIAGDSFAGSIGGSGDLLVQSIAVKSLALAIGGSGDMTVRSGQTGSAKYSIGGSGGIDVKGVRATDAKISIAGSGSVRGQATGRADVSIVGSGDVDLSGGARCSVSKMGSGDVRCS